MNQRFVNGILLPLKAQRMATPLRQEHTHAIRPASWSFLNSVFKYGICPRRQTEWHCEVDAS